MRQEGSSPTGRWRIPVQGLMITLHVAAAHKAKSCGAVDYIRVTHAWNSHLNWLAAHTQPPITMID